MKRTPPPLDRQNAPFGVPIVRSPAGGRCFGWAQKAGIRGPDEEVEAEPTLPVYDASNPCVTPQYDEAGNQIPFWKPRR